MVNGQLLALYTAALTGLGGFLWQNADRPAEAEHIPQVPLTDFGVSNATSPVAPNTNQTRARLEHESASLVEDLRKQLNSSDDVVAAQARALQDCESARADLGLSHKQVLEDKRAGDELHSARVTECEARNHQLRKESKEMRLNCTRDADACRTRAEACAAELQAVESRSAHDTEESGESRQASKWSRELLETANREAQKNALALEKMEAEKERVEENNRALQREKERVEEEIRTLRGDKERVETLQKEIENEKHRISEQGLEEGAPTNAGNDDWWWMAKDGLLMLSGLLPLLYQKREIGKVKRRAQVEKESIDAEFKATLLEKSRDVQKLQEQVVEKDRHIISQSTAFNELKENEIKKCAAIDDLENTVQHKSQREHDLQCAVRNLEQRLQEQSTEAASKETQLTEANGDLSNELVQFKERHTSHKVQVRETQAEVASLRLRLQTFEKELDEARFENASLHALNQELQNDKASLEAQISEREAEHAHTISGVESATKEHRASIAEMALQLETVQAEQTTWKDTLADERAAREAAEAKTRELLQALHVAEEKATKLEQQLTEKQLKLDAFEADMEERAEQLDKIQSAYKESQDAMEEIKRKEAAQEKKCKDLIDLLEQEADVRKAAEEKVAELEEEVVAKEEIVGHAALAVTLERQYNESQETIATLTAQLQERTSLEVARQEEAIAAKLLHNEQMEHKELELRRTEAKLSKAIRVMQDLEATIMSERDDRVVLEGKLKVALAEKEYAESQVHSSNGHMQECAEDSFGNGQPCVVECETEENIEGTKEGEALRVNKEDAENVIGMEEQNGDEVRDDAAAPFDDTNLTAGGKKNITEKEARTECTDAHTAELPRGAVTGNHCDNDMLTNDCGEKELKGIDKESHRVVAEQHSSSTNPTGAESASYALGEKSESALESPDSRKAGSRKMDMLSDKDSPDPSEERSVTQESPSVNKGKKKKNKKSGGRS